MQRMLSNHMCSYCTAMTVCQLQQRNSDLSLLRDYALFTYEHAVCNIRDA